MTSEDQSAVASSMSQEERLQTLTVVYEALMSEPPRLEAATLLYKSIPGFESLPLPTTSDLEALIHIHKGMEDRAQRMRESDERSDSGDNFASQWASGLGQQRDRMQMEILAAGGTALFPGLFVKATGERVPAKLIRGKFGPSWMLCDAKTGRATGKYFPDSRGPRSKLTKAGFEVHDERAPAKAIIDGHGTGFSGSAWAVTVRIDGGWPGAPEWQNDD